MAGLLAAEQVDRERNRRAEGLGDADPVEDAGVVRADDEEAPGGRQRRCGPQARRERPPVHELQPQKQQQWAEILDGERHADLQASDRGEVEGVDTREADDAKDRETADVASPYAE